jgi:hypothetical protein
MVKMLRTLPSLCQKAAAAAEEFTSTTRVVQEVQNGGASSFTETVRSLRFSRLSLAQKQALGLYTTGAVVFNISQTFNNGQEALTQHRTQKGRSQYATDWEAAYAGCRKDSFSIFWRSLLWPVSIASQVVPSLVLFMNKGKEGTTDGDKTPSRTQT